jgi:hypothetical protein
MSGEHVWSDWISRIFYPTPKPRSVLIKRERTGQPTTLRPAASMNVKPKIVCEPCNNNWLSDLENAYMKPLLTNAIARGASTTFAQDDLVAITAWAFKTAVVVDHMEHRRDPFFSPAQRQRFAVDFTFPTGTQLYLFRYNDHGHNALKGSFISHYLMAKRGPFKGLKLFVLTYVAGQFAFQIVSRKQARTVVLPSVIGPRDEFRGLTIAIWPNPQVSVRWPPPFYLGEDVLDAFGNRWRRVISANTPG